MRGVLAVLGLAAMGHAWECREADSLRIRDIRLVGLATTRRNVVLRELRQGPGEIFSCSQWEAEKTRLEDLDIFAEVSLLPVAGTGTPSPVPGSPARDTGAIDLVYTFRELPPYIPFVAMNKTEQDGLSLGPALASLNFLGRDIRVEILSRFGGTTEFQASASSPWLGSWPWEYDLAAIRVDSYNRFEAFREESWRFKLDLAQRLYPLGLRGRAQVLYAGELMVMRADRPGILLDPQAGGTDLVPRLGAGLLWDGRNRRRIPTRGWYQEVRVTQSGGPLGGRADFTEWLADTRLYIPWIAGVLQASGLYQYRTGSLGRTMGVYDRFHVGGINTLRGYGNDALRGKSEWLATLENRVDILGKRTFRLWRWSGYYGVQGVMGVEAASLWDHHAWLEEDYRSSIYTGMHLLIAGVDRIRLEVGSKSAKFELKFDIGILDKADIQRFRAR